MSEFHFLRPAWFLAFIPLAVLLVVLWRHRVRATAWSTVVAPALLSHLLLEAGRPARRIPLALLALGWLLAVTALAGPTWERQPQPVYRAPSDRVIVLDMSPSMAATDVKPDRLTRARYVIRSLLSGLAEGRTALVVFGAEPYVVTPLTDDVATIEALLPALSVDIMPAPGNLAAPALRKAGELLQRVGSTHADVLLLSDGIDDPADSLNAVRDLRERGVQTSVMGIGSEQAVPVPAAQGGFETGPDGRVRLARLDESGLAALASAGGGHYQRLGAGRPLDLLRNDAGRDPARARAERGGVQRWVEQGPWLLLPLLLLAAGGFRRGWLGVLAVFLVLPPPAHAFSWQDLWLRPDQQASRLLEQGEAAAAARRFQDPAWRATAQYRAGDYAAAAQSFGGQDADSQYNRGNALARAGKLQEAKAAYEAALARNAGDKDARFNRDLVDKLLRRQQTQSGQDGKTGSQQDGKSGTQQDGKSGSQQDGKSGSAQAGQSGAQQDGKSGSAQPGQSGAQQDQQSGSAHNGQAGGGDQKNATGKAAEAASAPNGQSGHDAQRQDKGAGAGKQPEKTPADTADRQAMKSSGSGQVQPQSAAANIGAGEQQRPPDSADRARSDVSAAAGEQPPADAGARAASSGDTPGKPGSPADAQQQHPPSEQDVALEQWLRQVPDDPAGLLRRKFMLEHLLRQKERQTP